jgi:quercetin dioxygenase-like cupin family protein
MTEPSEPQIVWMPAGLRIEIHLTSTDTDGAFCLLVDGPPVSYSLPLHLHRNEAETVHIVDGEFEIEVDRQLHQLGPGQTIHIPKGIVHGSRNVGQRPGRRVLLFSPAGIEHFFLEIGAPSPDLEIDQQTALASASRHGWVFT